MIHLTKRFGSFCLACCLFALSACSHMNNHQKSYAQADKMRYCRPGNGVVFRTSNPEKVDPIRLLKDSEHSCR